MRRALAGILPTLLLASAAATSPASGGTSATLAGPAGPSNGRILFTHCEDATGCQIYTANPDGSAVDLVTSGGDSVQGDWSPTGDQIAYVGFNADAAIWIVDADGGNARQLTPDDPSSDNLWPRFSSDGAWILFTNCLGDDCDGGISAIRPDGTGMHHVTRNSHRSYNYADQSPSGSRMAYMRWRVNQVKMAVYVSSADGDHQHRVTPPRLEGWAPDWSPTGRRIAFTSYVFWDRPAPSLYTVRPDGSGVAALTHPRSPHSDVRPAYSPDGRKVLFESDRRYDDFCCSDLFTVPAHGGPAQRVRLPFDAYEARWGTAALEPVLRDRSLATVGTHRIGGPPCARVRALAGVSPCR